MSGSGANRRAHGPMRRVLGNFGFLLRGRGIAALLALGATTLMARALGPTEFGLVVLIQAYTLLMRGLLDFRSVEAVVRYGVPAHDSGDTRTLRRLIAVCRRVDRNACLAATAIALILSPLAGPLMGVGSDHAILLSAYTLVLLTTGNSNARGILRLFDQFDILGRQMTIGPTIRFVGVVTAWWLDGSLPVFVAILAVAYASENLYVGWRGRHEYKRRVDPPPPGESDCEAQLAEFPGLRHFLWVTYWQSNMDLVPKHLATVLAGYLLGPAEAGLLRLAHEISSVLSKPAGLIREVVFPDLTRSWHQGSDSFNLIAYRTALLGGGFGLLFVLASLLFGVDLLAMLVGKKFVAAAPVLTLMLLAATFDLATSSLRSAAYAIGHAGTVLRMYALSAVIYVTLFVALTSSLGLIGAGVAACVAAALPSLGIALLIRGDKYAAN